MTEQEVKPDLQKRLESEGWVFLGNAYEENMPLEVDTGLGISLVFDAWKIPREGLLREPQLKGVPKLGPFKEVCFTDGYNGFGNRMWSMRGIYVKEDPSTSVYSAKKRYEYDLQQKQEGE